MALTTIDRTLFNTLVDDDGSGTTGSIFDKSTYKDIYDKVDALYARAARCSVVNNGTQAIPSAAIPLTPLTFNTDEHDDYAMHDPAVNSSRITIPAGMGGHYLISGSCAFPTNAAGIRLIVLRKNGSTLISTYGSLVGLSGLVVVTAQTLAQLAAGEYVEAIVYQDCGNALNVGHASSRDQQNQMFAARIL